MLPKNFEPTKTLQKYGFSDFFIAKFAAEIARLIKISLEEDLDKIGDITSDAVLSENKIGSAKIIAKQNGIFSGGFLIKLVSAAVDPQIKVTVFAKEGVYLTERQEVSSLKGSLKSILIAERTILNFISRTSGISTLTNIFVKAVQQQGVTILDTRKTFPGWRYLDKYAVKVGGGKNHRIGLFDMFLIKENHIKAAGGIPQAVQRCREFALNLQTRTAIEVETTNFYEVKEALDAKADRIMLDNMEVEEIKRAVKLIKETNKDVEIELSGGVGMENIAELADTGVDFISIGSLTHSARAFDFSLLVE